MNLNYAQQNAVESESPTTLVVAGPGSGKTAVIVERIRWLLARGGVANEIAAITFTNAAAAELRGRLAAAGARIWFVGTLHSFMLLIIREYGGLAGLDGSRVTVMDDMEKDEVITSLSKSLRVTVTKKRFAELLDECYPGADDSTRPQDPARTLVRAFLREVVGSGAYPYDLILTFGLLVLRHHPLFRLQDLLVDEFQDSGKVDARIYDRIAADRKFYVGDPDQAIYGFRGGSLSEILSLSRRTTTNVVRLEANYRSGTLICQTAQLLINRNADRVPKQTIAVSTEAGAVEVWKQFDTENDEIEHVGAAIQKRLANGGDPSEIALLFRYNATLKTYAAALALRGIPVARRPDQPAMPDYDAAVCFIGLMGNPWNDRLAKFYIALVNVPERAGAVAREAAAAGRTINDHEFGFAHQPAAKAPELLRLRGFSEQTVAHVATLLDRLDPNVSSAELVLAMTKDPIPDALSPGVTLSTIHGAKGREWDVVVLPGWDEGVFPSGKNIEEERRLAYVAVTRARHVVVVTSAKTRAMEWRQLSNLNPSPFIKELL